MGKNKTLKEVVDLEKRRDLLYRTGKMELLGKLYKKGTPYIVNRNSSRYWNKHLNFSGEIGEMDKDKIDLISLIIKQKGGRILDIGFGAGNLEKRFVNVRDIDLYGIDMSPLALKHARENYQGKFYQSSILKIPFPAKFFDVCICLEVLEHISPHSTIKALSEVKRVLKRSGLIIVSVPLNENLVAMEERRQNISAHVRQYTDNIIKGELLLSGFNILHAQHLFAFKNYYTFKKILRRFIFRNRWKPNNFLVVAKPE